MMVMGYSDRCPDDLTTRWDGQLLRCVLCSFLPGHEVTPNCGFDDYGGRHESPVTACKANTFNDGSGAYCRPCTSCRPGFSVTSPCSSTTDTQCRESRNTVTEASVEQVSLFVSRTTTTNQGAILKPIATTLETLFSSPPTSSDAQWAVPVAILISTTLVVLTACVGLLYMKRRRGEGTVLSYNRRSSYINAGFAALSDPPSTADLEDIVGPAILSAPLQTVLDNLDVLEELVILLDPESQGVKNTKHLASHCAFTSTWITYIYSMRDSKSPLKAVLEGVTSRHPEWTVGHLAKLLRQMERNDAIAVLTKLSQNEIDM